MSQLAHDKPDYGGSALLFEEIEKRKLLLSVIDKIIDTFFEPNKKGRVRKFKVHNVVVQALELILNNNLRRMINEVMHSKGYRDYIFHGDAYFKGAQIRAMNPDILREKFPVYTRGSEAFLIDQRNEFVSRLR